MLSHGNLLAGSRIVCRYLGIRDTERILSVLPFSFDYGLNQLLTAVEQGATTILLTFRFGHEIVRAIHDEAVTALAGVPGLWAVLSDATPAFLKQPLPSLRYLTNSGGAMPLATLARIRAAQPHADVVLMYGLTEAFRSTYLPGRGARPSARPRSARRFPRPRSFLVDDHGNACRPGEDGHPGPRRADGLPRLLGPRGRHARRPSAAPVPSRRGPPGVLQRGPGDDGRGRLSSTSSGATTR